MEKIKTENKFNQIVVWPGTIIVDINSNESVSEQIKKFNDWIKKESNFRVKYLEEIKTNSDIDKQGNPVPGTGNRNDVMFYIHDDDINKFALWRFKYGMRWLEDAINNSPHLYPDRVKQWRTW